MILRRSRRRRTVEQAAHTKSSADGIGISNDSNDETDTKRNSLDETMEAFSSSQSMCSLPSRYGMTLIVACCCLWSLTLASGFNQGVASSARVTGRAPSPEETSSSLIMEAIPDKQKFNRLRSPFSRTRRGYRNDGGFEAIDEVESSTTEEVGSATVDERDIFEVVTQDKETGEKTRVVIGKRIRAIRETNQKLPTSNLIPPLKTALEKQKKKKKEPVIVKTVDELRNAILDEELSLSDTKITEDYTNTAGAQESSPLLDHAVRELIKERYLSKSTPGNRLATDNSTLAIAIEGGGMRGCVSAGMVAAITALGLSDTIDNIYGSSAGSVVGAYMVSRQMCMDVYVDILPASKKLFVCKKRMITNLASMGLGRLLGDKKGSNSSANKNKNLQSIRPSISLKERLSSTPPGMNISFVLDGILGQDHGLRPLDIETFKENGKHQKLRVVSSCVDPHTGKLFSRCFGNEDFFCEENTMVRADQKREGIFVCLQASMTVPGATGPPVEMVRKSSIKSINATTTIEESPVPCFDAFCFEPIPYRSAVEEGATHVIVCASRPADFVPPTKQGVYETGIAPLYFDSHGQRKVSNFFAKGGQQYLYAEDLMLLEQAKHSTEDGLLVPPPEIMYGVERTDEISRNIRDRHENWNRAHLFPLRVPKGYKELATLEQDKDEVLQAVRDGFMTAFDALSDIVGLDGLKGEEVAKLVFPSSSDSDESSLQQASPTSMTLTSREQEILGTRLHVPGQSIPRYEVDSSSEEEDSSNDEPQPRKRKRRRFFRRIKARGGGLFGRGSHSERTNERVQESHKQNVIRIDENDFSATSLLECLPGFQDGKYSHLAKGLFEEYAQEQQER